MLTFSDYEASVAQGHKGATVNAKVVASTPNQENKISHIYISSLW